MGRITLLGAGAPPAAAASNQVFIGLAETRGIAYSGGNQTWTLNGGVNLPAGLVVIGVVATDALPSSGIAAIGATALTRVGNTDDDNTSLWAAVYAGGSDTLTMGVGGSHSVIGIASAWTNFSLNATPTSSSDQEYGVSDAHPGAHLTLDATVTIPSGGVGFVVAGTTNSGTAPNAPNWSNVNVSPAPSDGAAASGRISLAVQTTSGSWAPEFWGSTAGGWNFASGAKASAFGP